MSPNHKLSLQACLLLFIASQRYRLKSINYFKREHAQTQYWSNFEITMCSGYLEYKIKIIKIYFTLFCLPTMYLNYASLVEKNPLVQKAELRKG